MKAKLIAGVDEAGRGPLAGDVVAAAVILNPAERLEGLDDSKRLSETKRNELYKLIVASSLSYAVGRASHEEIDQLNIHNATLLAMQRAVDGLSCLPTEVLVDGKFTPNLDCPARAIIGGDKEIPEISAASIIAKVTRDLEMVKLDAKYPGYGFAKHKGYPTKQHLQALEQLGVSQVHRRSYAPVQRCLQQEII